MSERPLESEGEEDWIEVNIDDIFGILRRRRLGIEIKVARVKPDCGPLGDADAQPRSDHRRHFVAELEALDSKLPQSIAFDVVDSDIRRSGSEVWIQPAGWIEGPLGGEADRHDVEVSDLLTLSLVLQGCRGAGSENGQLSAESSRPLMRERQSESRPHVEIDFLTGVG